jgi:biotin/methionine sulfoxide reductase
VFPVTTTLERNDIGCGRFDGAMIAMRQVSEPVGESMNDYDVFSQLSKRLGVHDEFTENLDEFGWLARMYEQWRAITPDEHTPAENFAEFWEKGRLHLTGEMTGHVMYEDFRRDPDAGRLATPSGRIEIVSDTIGGFGYDDCPPHPAWLAPPEAQGLGAGRYPLCLIANNPKTRLHSQLDHGAYSMSSKVQGREPIRIHPDDAASRSISDGDLVLVRSATGQMLAGAVVDDHIARHVAQVSTGAWYDYSAPEIADCVHGNPNVLTPDVGTSRLAQGSTGQLVRIEIETYEGNLPPVSVHDQRSWLRY